MFELTASIEIKWKMFHVYKSMSIDIVQVTWYKRRKRTKHTCIMTFLFYSFAYLNYFTQHVSVIGGLIYFALLRFALLSVAVHCAYVYLFLYVIIVNNKKAGKWYSDALVRYPFFAFKCMTNMYTHNISKCQKATHKTKLNRTHT